MDAKSVAQQIFLSGVRSVLPENLIGSQISLKDHYLKIQHWGLPLKEVENIYVIGAGKASAHMAREIESILGNRITGGHVVVKYGYNCPLQYVEVTQAGHPVPDTNSFHATTQIMEIARKANRKDLIICLISGGGSALFADLPEGVSSDEMIVTSQLLLKCGADISEINTIRKHLSKVKGGQLAFSAFPAMVITLILSDVVNDPLDVIASGPTVPDPSTFEDALTILEKYQLRDMIPGSIISYLDKGVEGVFPETPKEGNPVFEKVHNFIIGNNRSALAAARSKATELGLDTMILTSELDGDTLKMTSQMVNTASRFSKDPVRPRPCCLLLGGETTLKVEGEGQGGRNQHMALFAAILLQDIQGVTLLAAGTDGTDGPTPAAGAVVDRNTVAEAKLHHLDPQEFLNNFDSYHFFKSAGGQIITGPTMTNVMDLIVIIIEQAGGEI